MLDVASETLFEACPDGAVLCDSITGEVVAVNDRFCALAGVDAETLRGRPLDAFAHDTESRSALAPETADPWTIRSDDGRPVDLALSVGDVDADAYRLVTARAAPETGAGAGTAPAPEFPEAAEESPATADVETYRRRLDGTMIAGGLAWWEMDVETGRVAFHDNKAEMLGYAPERFDHYEDFTDLLHPDDYEPTMQAMRDHLEGEAERYDAEYRIRTSDGDYQWFHDIGGVTGRTPDGAPATVNGIVIDVSESKELEGRLQEQNDQLGLLNRLVRHDIRNEMAVALGWLETIVESCPDDVNEDLQRVVGACERTIELTTLSRDLMDVIVEEEAALDPVPVALREVVVAEVEKARKLFSEADISVTGTVPDAEVRANALLSSVLSNLLNNAVQHNDKETPVVTVSVDLGGETARIRVADNGPGLPEDPSFTLFGYGQKGLDSEGTGMGLYLVDTLVTGYGGGVRVEPNDPTGTVFVVELPLA